MGRAFLLALHSQRMLFIAIDNGAFQATLLAFAGGGQDMHSGANSNYVEKLKS
jgi:hypothetical protein